MGGGAPAPAPGGWRGRLRGRGCGCARGGSAREGPRVGGGAQGSFGRGAPSWNPGRPSACAEGEQRARGLGCALPSQETVTHRSSSPLALRAGLPVSGGLCPWSLGELERRQRRNVCIYVFCRENHPEWSFACGRSRTRGCSLRFSSKSGASGWPPGSVPGRQRRGGWVLAGQGRRGAPVLSEPGSPTPGCRLPPGTPPGLLCGRTDWELHYFSVTLLSLGPRASVRGELVRWGRLAGSGVGGPLFSPRNCLGGPGQGSEAVGRGEEGRAVCLMAAELGREAKGEVPQVCPSPPPHPGPGASEAPWRRGPRGPRSPSEGSRVLAPAHTP